MRLPFATPSQLRRQGVLGINQRNADYILRYNQRQLYPLVDNKLKTKQLAIANGIAVPELYGVVSTVHDASKITELLANYQELVIKPAHGSGGNGIMVIDGRVGKFYQKASGDLVSTSTIEHHVNNILSGMYSLGGNPDQAIIEYRVKFDPFFSRITYKGVPDIRVIVFRGIPIMAMVRLPTRQSDGKANLHQGAMGVGIHLDSGETSFAVCHSKHIEAHPDTEASIRDITIPHWDNILRLAIKCADTVGLGYLGVDIVLDQELGPLVLELNARPGLNVQLAVGQGLLHSLKTIDQLTTISKDIDQRLDYCKQLRVHADRET